MEETDFWQTKTYKNQTFLNSPEARQIRILCELTAPKKRFEDHQVENTIVFFGSARSKPKEAAEGELKEIEEKFRNANSKNDELQHSLQQAQNTLKLSKYYEASAQLAQKLTEWSLTIPDPEKRFYVCSGGGPGMMEAANYGAAMAKGSSIGFNISLPREQHPNPFQTPALSFEFHYFFIRKFWLVYLAKAMVALPGGFGTMDELFELLTLLQTKKVGKTIPIILFGSEYWERVLNFEVMVEWGLINETDLSLFRYFDEVDEAFEYLRDTLTKHYLIEDK